MLPIHTQVAKVAQSVERGTFNPEVQGSSPCVVVVAPLDPKYNPKYNVNGYAAGGDYYFLNSFTTGRLQWAIYISQNIPGME